MNNNIKNITDCWNKTGVWRTGLEVCPKLEQVIHCHNCPTYVNAGLSLLNREVPDDYIANNTSTYRQSKTDTSQELLSCVIFRKANEWLALPSTALNEISELKPIHSLPHVRSNIIAGLANIRGELEICIAIENALTLNQHSSSAEKIIARMIVIILDSGKYVIEVDEVLGIFKIPVDTISQPPATLSQEENNLINGIFDYDEKHIGMLDCKRLNNITEESLQ